MSRLQSWWRDLAALVSRRGADADIDEEILLHLELQTERHVRAGLSRAEARRRALVEFGGVERFRERTADERLGRYADELARDVRLGVRSLLRSPVYALGSIVLLALGIGAGTAMFTVAYGVLARDLPYPDAHRIYNLLETTGAVGGRTPSYPSFQDWESQLTAFESIAYARGDEFRLRGEDGTQRLLASYVSDGFFTTFGTAPQLGRRLEAGEEGTSAVLSDHLWRRSFGADPHVLGTTIATADGSYVIVGVMPPGFRIPSYADVWLSVRALPPDGRFALTQRDLHVDSEAWGKVRDGVTAVQAQQDLARVVGLVAAAYPEDGRWTGARLTDIRTHVVGNAGNQLRILIGAVALVLLLTCVNVAGLQLARGSARTREVAVRAALGAGRGRIVRQLLTECALLSIAGGALGTVLAWFAVGALTRQLPDVLPRLGDIAVDPTVLAFAFGLSLLTAVFAGVLPALAAMRPDLTAALRSGAAASGVSGGTSRVRAALVSAQIALAIVLVTGSALLLRSLATLQSQELGFSADDVMVLRVFPPPRYADADAAQALYERLRESVLGVPGVREVALANHVPFGGGWMTTRFVTGLPAPEAGENVLLRTVSPEYFDVLRTPLVSGRVLAARDWTVGSGVVINTAAARQFFGETDPVGRTVTIFHGAQGRPEFGEPIAATIVGVVEAERYFGIAQDAPPAVFVPWSWMVWTNITLVARTSGTVPLAGLRAAVHGIDPDIPVAGPARQAEWRPLEHFIGFSLRQRRLTAGLFTGFGAVALALALTGIFGTTAYLVAQRRREIAIRSAIGASRGRVVRLVLSHAARLALLGAAVGMPAAIAAGVLLRAELFGVSATDPLTVIGVTLCFVVAAVLAAAVPAARATTIHPAVTLRND